MSFSWFKRKPDVDSRAADGASMRAVRDELASESCAPLLRDVLERFPELDPDQAQALVHDVVEQFFHEVMDVGASESHHHAGEWGLARHSLETAVFALRLARTRHFVGHAAPNPEEQEHRLPRLRYACFLVALYHDVGKLLQLRGVGPGREEHNPFIEPLGIFYDRHGRDRCEIAWREGRGVDGHSNLTPYLIGRLLPKAAALYIGAQLIAEIIEEKTPSAREVHEILVEADQHSVRHERRKAEAKAALSGPAYASGSFVSYLPKAFSKGCREGNLVVNVFGGDVLVGRRFAFFSYPDAILKLISVIRECFGAADAGARMLAEDEGGARFLLAKLKTDDGVFVDQATGRWMLRARIRLGSESEIREGVLVPLASLGLKPGVPETFAGSVVFHRLSDGSEVAVDDFTAPAPVPPVKAPSVKPRETTPVVVPKHADPVPAEAPAPIFVSRVPATLGPVEGIQPEELVRNLIDGILAGWIPTNVPQGHVYVTAKTTFVATPITFVRMREQGLYPEFDPQQDRRSAYLTALAKLDYVQKTSGGRVVYPILLGPDSERPLKVVKFVTVALFRSEEVRNRVGVWGEAEKIIELPQAWKPGDAVVAMEANS